jgi:ubiquinone/menaquinone biosynthesis C-methylase UbiE
MDFVHGDAQSLPFADESFDVVINIEASHGYPDFPRFLAEVARVLRPGGRFLYADVLLRQGLSGVFSVRARSRRVPPHCRQGTVPDHDPSVGS